MKFCETKEEFIAWATELWERHEKDKAGIPDIMDMAELFDYKEPESIWADGECDYRRGFCHGVAYSVELIDHLKRRGYVRPSEISTIIDDFNLRRVYPWRYKAREDISDKKWREGHPKLEIDPWNILREKVFNRDGRRCRHCGSGSELECDHIDSVHGGGMPTMDNLQTLCGRCNRRKGY